MPAGAGPPYDFTIPAGIGGWGRYGFRFKLTSFAGAITITCRYLPPHNDGRRRGCAGVLRHSLPPFPSPSLSSVIPVSQVMLCLC